MINLPYGLNQKSRIKLLQGYTASNYIRYNKSSTNLSTNIKTNNNI